MIITAARTAGGRAPPGTWVQLKSPEVGELAAAVGFVVVVDMGLGGDHRHPAVREALARAAAAAGHARLDCVGVTVEESATASADAVEGWWRAGGQITTAQLDRIALGSACSGVLGEVVARR